MPDGMRTSSSLLLGPWVLCAAAAFAYLLVFQLPFTPIYLENDSLIFLSDAQRIAAGEVMYRDFFQFTFPGIQVLYRSLFAVAGESYWLLPALIVVTAAATTGVMIALARRISNDTFAISAPAIVFIFFGFRYYGLEGTHRVISPIVIMAALWLLLSRERTYKTFIAAGALCGLTSFFTQQRGIATLTGIAAWLVLEQLITRSSWRRLAKQLALLLGGFLFALSVSCGYFIASAGFGTFWNSTMVYPWLYYGADDQNAAPALVSDLANAFSQTSPQGIVAALAATLYGIVIPITALVSAALVLWRSKRDWDAWRKHALIALVWLCLLLSTMGPSPIRLYQISGPALILIFGTFWQKGSSRGRVISPSAVVALAILAGSQVWRTQVFWQYQVQTTPTGAIAFPKGPIADRYQWLLAHTTAGDHVYEARQPYAYFPLQLRNPTPISQAWESDYTRPEQVDQVIDGLQATKTKYVLWEIPYDKPPEQRSPADHLAPLFAYLGQHYQKVPDAAWSIEHGSQIEVWERVR